MTQLGSGLGFAITAHLLRANAAKIITISSRRASAVDSINQLASYGDTSRITYECCNLKSLNQVDALARKIRSTEPRIDALVLNAGIGIVKYSLSEDGIDSHFQVNILSQLHIALVLLPILQSTARETRKPSRVVFMTSATHAYAPSSTRFLSLAELNTDIGQQDLYYRSKLAQILIVRELVRRLDTGLITLPINPFDPPVSGHPTPSHGGREVLINATHPGDYNRTPLTSNLTVAFGFLGYILLFILGPFMSDPMIAGCKTALFAATPNADLLGKRIDGQYIVPDKQVKDPSEMAQDAEMGKRLWELTMELLRDRLGEKFDYELRML